MIGPAPGWEHVDMRLQQGSVRFLVQPVKVVTSMGTVYTEQVAANKANGFEVILQDGPSPTGGPSTDGGTSLATFADVQDAWEFAAIATHYVNARSPAKLVDGIGDTRTGSQRPNGIVDDRSAMAVFEAVVGDDTAPIESLQE